jgi:hypothetical protein
MHRRLRIKIDFWDPATIGRFSRRTVLQGAGALGIGGVLAVRGAGATFAQGATPSAGAYPEVVITARDMAFEMPASFEGGWTQLTLDNQGPSNHHAIFLRVNDGSTVEDVQAALQLPEFGPVFGVATSAGGPNIGPGLRGSVIDNLEPGPYVVICAIPDETSVPHYAMGMLAVIEVTEPAAEAEAPVADAAVSLVEMEFQGLPADVTAGMHLWEITDQGDQVHEIIVGQIADGVPFEVIQEIFLAAPPASPVDTAEATPVATPATGPPPFEFVAGTAPKSPGQTNWLVLDLVAGEYFAICFVPDPGTGAPHFALGMLMPFTVS